tara:strand:- start:5607 stop:6371 length:765 start_codon:yes stop_codon:yes gene_type:complete
MIKNLFLKILEKKGFVSKWSLPDSKYNYDALYVLLFALQKKKYKIIQIGANDGVTGDPINRFIKDFYKSITYIGFEPQVLQFNKLKKNYQNYENFYFINQCIGKEGKTKFYYLNKHYQDLCKKRNWRFTGGTNSLIKENLSERLIKNDLNPENYIESFQVEVLSLKKSIEKNYNNLIENFIGIDLLQVDAEGYDDEVIYNSSINFFKPKYINFEYKNLSKTKLEKLVKFLNYNHYNCINWKTNDCLAVSLKDNH